MRARIAVLILALTLGMASYSRAQGTRPNWAGRVHVSALRDWRFVAGEAVIATVQILDGYSSCRAFGRGYVEGNPVFKGNHSCRNVGLQMGGAFAFDTTLNLLEHKYGAGDPSRFWRNFAAWSIPAIAVAVHGSAAAHNFSLADKSAQAIARARIGPDVPQGDY